MTDDPRRDGGPPAPSPEGADAPLLVCNLGSGSRGNVTYVGRRDAGVLVDIGFSCKRTGEKLRERGIAPEQVRAILLTHEHGDHVRGARVFARKYRVPVYVHEAARDQVDLRKVPDVRTFDGVRPFEVDGFEVRPLTIPHDTVEPVAFVLDDGHQRVGIATDMGMPTHLVAEELRRCRAVLLEFNHDVQMLMEGPYPWWLKQRVRGRLGHLSNDDALGMLEQIVEGGVEVALLGHLSQENNSPALVEALARQRLADRGRDDVAIEVLDQDVPGPVVCLGRELIVGHGAGHDEE